MALRPYEGGRFEEIGSEEAHTIETFERHIGGTPYSEPQQQISSQKYTERRTFGRDENGEVVVKIEKNPSDPIRPVSPLRPVSPIGDHRHAHLLRPIQPLTIPRIDVRSSSPMQSPRRDQGRASPRSHYAASPSHSVSISPKSVSFSPHSNSSSGSNSNSMKKIIKKSRWISVHDGRPVSPYIETVTYEPSYPDRYSSLVHHQVNTDQVLTWRMPNRTFSRGAEHAKALLVKIGCTEEFQNSYAVEHSTTTARRTRKVHRQARYQLTDRGSMKDLVGLARVRIKNFYSESRDSRSSSLPASARSGRSVMSTHSLSPSSRRVLSGSCAYIVQNPLYRD